LIASLAPQWVRSGVSADSQHPQRSWINAGPAGTFIGKHGQLTGAQGYTDSILPADAAKGTQYLHTIIESTASWLVQVGNWMNEGMEGEA
jgi:creatinine amidohydrolase